MKIITKKKERKIKSKECWNIDYELIKWLNEHLKIYKEETSKTVDLEYYKFNYKRKEYTQLQIIDMLIEKSDYLLDEIDYFVDANKYEKYKNEIYDLMKLVHWHMWW